MKAKHFILGNKEEIVLSTGKKFAKKVSTPSDEFVTKVTEWVSNELLEELELTQVTEETVKKMKLPAAKKAVESATGLYKQLLEARINAAPARASKPKDGKQGTGKGKATTPKPKKERKPKPSYEEALKLRDKTRKLIGKSVEFTAYRTEEKHTGTLKSVHIDKRVNMVMGRIEVPGKKKADKARVFHKLPSAFTVVK